MSLSCCYYCFAAMDGKAVCPHCGAPVSQEATHRRALSPGTEMRDRYLAGYVFAQDPLGILYYGYDRQQKKQVWIREYLPEGLAGRMDGESSLLPLEGDLKALFDKGKDLLMERAKEMAQYNTHPGMARMDCYFEENGTAYIVMDRSPGKSLLAHLQDRGGKLEWAEALRITRPVVGLLRQMHEGGTVHGYVSPANIYVGADGQGVLIGFNILGGAEGLPIGNASYLPQGIYDPGAGMGPRVDIYGVAATLYHLIAGERPVPAADPISGEKQVDRPSRRGIVLPAQAEEVLIQVLAQADVPWSRSMEAFGNGILGQKEPSGGERKRHTEKKQKVKSSPRIRRQSQPSKKPGKWIWLGPVLGAAAALLVVLTLAGIRYFGAEGLYRDGMESLRLGRTGEAITSFKMAMERFPWADQKYEDIYHQTQGKDFAQKAREAIEWGSYEEAIDLYEKAVNEDPTNTEYSEGKRGAEKFKEGYLLYEDGQFAKAKLSFEASLGILPSNSHISGLIAGIDAWSEGRDAFFAEDYEAAFNAYSKALEYDEDNAHYITLCEQANNKWQAAEKLGEALYLLDIGEYILAYESMVEAAELDPDEEYDELVATTFMAAQIEYFYEVLQQREYTDNEYLSLSKITEGPDHLLSVDTLPYHWDCMCIYVETPKKLTVDTKLYLIDGLSEDERIFLGGGEPDHLSPSYGLWIYWGDDVYSPGIYCIELTLEGSDTVVAREYVRVMNEDETITE